MKRTIALALGLAMLVGVAACNKTAINSKAETSFLDSTDLVTMTDQMAAAIASDSDVAAVTARKPMIVVMQELRNRTNEILRSPGKEIFVHRVRALLAEKQVLRQQFKFVLNRNAYDRLLKQEGFSASNLGETVDRIVPEYALTATFYADTKVNLDQRSDYYLCTYQLTHLGTGQILWEGKYETKKAITKDFLD